MKQNIYVELRIYIPTFQRPRSLQRQLQCLHYGFMLLSPDEQRQVRVFVAINGMAQKADYLQVLQESRYPLSTQLEWGFRPANIGGNANILLGYVTASDSRHVWVLSDNDYLLPNVLPSVLRTCKDANPDILILASSDGEENESSAISWADMTCFIKSPIYRLGLISRGIYKLSYISESLELLFHYHNTSFPHLAMSLGALRRNNYAHIYKLGLRAFDHDLTIKDELYDDKAYDLSRSGRLQLALLLPPLARQRFIEQILLGNPLEFLRSFRSYGHNALSSLILAAAHSPRILILFPIAVSYDFANKLFAKIRLIVLICVKAQL